MCASSDDMNVDPTPVDTPELETLSLESFVALCQTPSSLYGRQLYIDSVGDDFSETSIEIKADCVLKFNSAVDFRIKGLIIARCQVGLSDLSIHGALSFRSGNGILSRCHVQSLENETESLLDGLDSSSIAAYDSTFGGHEQIGIFISGVSMLRLVRCEVGRCKLVAVTLFEQSTIECDNCHFFESDDDAVTLYTGSSGIFRTCRFELAKREGLRADTCPSCIVEDCHFAQCDQGGFRAENCDDCRIERSGFRDVETSAIILSHTRCVVNDIVVVNADGNGIWVRRHSDATINRSSFEGMTWPALCISERSVCTIDSVSIRRFQWTGIGIRDAAKVTVSCSNIEDSPHFGIVSRISTSVTVANTVISRCQTCAVLSLNHSAISLTNCRFIGPSEISLRCCTGGRCSLVDCTFQEMPGQMM
jgi:hypothetical protein